MGWAGATMGENKRLLSSKSQFALRQDCNSDLALVSTQGIEIFRLNFEQKTCKSLKTFPTAVRICWLDPTASTVLLCTGTRTLQPFDFRRRNPKLPRFDLVAEFDLGGRSFFTCVFMVMPLPVFTVFISFLKPLRTAGHANVGDSWGWGFD